VKLNCEISQTAVKSWNCRTATCQLRSTTAWSHEISWTKEREREEY